MMILRAKGIENLKSNCKGDKEECSVSNGKAEPLSQDTIEKYNTVLKEYKDLNITFAQA